MISVSNEFKTAVKAETKEIKAYLSDQELYPTQINDDDDLKSIQIKQESSLLKTVLRSAVIKHYGTHNFLEKNVNIGIGVVLADTSVEYIDFGTFKVIDRKTEKGSDIITIKAYDLMIESLLRWDLDPIYDITYPTNLKGLVEAICTRLGWTLGTTEFLNSNLVLNGDFEDWATATDANDWAESLGGSSTVNQDTTDMREGTSALRIDIDGSNTNASVNQQVAVTGDQPYKISFWGKSSASGALCTLEVKDDENYYLQSDGTWSLSSANAIQLDAQDWELAEISFTARTTASSVRVLFKRAGACSNQSLWFDSARLYNTNGYTIDGDYFTGAINTYREALEMICEMTGTIAYFDVDDTLKFRSVSHFETLEDLDGDILQKLDVSTKFQDVNSVVLARTPQEDNITKKDQTDIDANGVSEIKIENNLLVDADRETYVEPIYNELHGLGFYPFSAEMNGLLYFQIGDRIIVRDTADNPFETVILGIEIVVAGGIKERIFSDTPDKTTTNYNYAGIIGQEIRNTQIIVDKQKGEITILNADLNEAVAQINITTDTITQSVNEVKTQADTLESDLDTVQSDLTVLQQTATELEVAVSGIGGTNLLKNSVGLKGIIEEWQLFDENGDLIDVNNDGTIDQSTDVETNGESGSAIRLDEQYIEQTFPTITGETYTFFCRYRSLLTATLSITGISNATLPAETEWVTYKKQFVASGDSTTVRISNVSAGAGAYIIMTDLIVKLGDANGWVQAPNEVYGKNFKFDKDGFEVSSLTDAFKSLLDNQKLAVYDTNTGKIVMLVSKDSGIITKLIAQDEFVVQRYENSDASARFIPTDTGMMLVINDLSA